jgi:hypothetical protein
MICDEPLEFTWAYQLWIGAVAYDDDGAFFVQEDHDSFRDGENMKWLCAKCADDNNVFIDDLTLDYCRAVDGCGREFEPVQSDQSECILLLEWGELIENDSNKGPDIVFRPEIAGHIHFNCAVDSWNIPLWSIDASDTP